MIPYGIGDNQFSLGGWYSQTPVLLPVPDRFGITNPFRDMIGNDQVYIIDNDIDMTLEYLRTWYAPDACAKEVRQPGKYTIYQIKTYADSE